MNLHDLQAGFCGECSHGDIDFMVTAWLLLTHQPISINYRMMVDLGPLYNGAAIGLVVPAMLRSTLEN